MTEKVAHGIYGVYVFFLLHQPLVGIEKPRHLWWRIANWEKLLLKFVHEGNETLYGRAIDTGLMPEARRVYLRLCARYNVYPEAVRVKPLDPLSPRVGINWVWPD